MSALLALLFGAQPVTIVAHRGLAEGLPENTLAAFRQSIARGVKVIELDLRITRDGQLVVIHDKTLDRTTNCSGRVADRTLAELRQCDAGHGERVPTFEEVIALVREHPVRLLADVKAGTPPEPVLRDVREQQAEQQVILGLRSVNQVKRARAALPRSTIIAFMPAQQDSAAFAGAGANILRLWSDWVDADAALVARTRALGPQVWVMVGRKLPEKDGDWRALHQRMIAAGAQGLITDRPNLADAAQEHR